MDKRINVRFFDKNLKFIGELDAYEGLEFITRWTKTDEKAESLKELNARMMITM